MTFPPVARRIRHVHRYAQILEVLATNGFADVAEELGLANLIERGRAILGGAPQNSRKHIPHAQRLRKVLEELGPTFVKLGQVMSTRPDLVPQEWADEFKSLQNHVPGVEFGVVRKMLDNEFPGGTERLFTAIEQEPLAAGSMAQVHRATLRDGTKIVLKVLRPGLKDVTTVDMEILRALAECVEGHFANLGYSPIEVVNEFARELEREVDLMHEGRSTERLGSLFAGDKGIVFPKVYWEATTQRVLAIEEIDGLVLANLSADALGREERRACVKNGARAVFMQCLEFRFFHADPHPGNLIALPEGRIAFIDCGMIGQIDARTARQLAGLVSGVVSGDVERVIAAAGAITDSDAATLEDRALRAAVNEIVSEFRGTPLERLNLGRVLREFFAALRAHQIRCPADIMLLIKALSTIEAVAHDLDPSFELVAEVRPYLERLVGERYAPSALKDRVGRGLLEYAELAEDLPGELRPILAQIRKNKLTVNLEHRGLERVTRVIEHASRNIAFALIIAAMFVGSAILVLAAREMGKEAFMAVGIAGFTASSILAALMIVSNWRRGAG